MGNLISRTETVLTPASQIYTYDRLDRVIDDGAAIVYDAAGNISSRGATGYTYAAGTHRMTGHGATGYGYDANGNVTIITSGTSKTIAPTAFNLPASITQGSTTLSYIYDGAHRRIKETATTAAGTTTTYYLGSYEELTRTDGVTERRHWIGTPEGAAGIHTTRSDGSTASRYWLTDHLGSVVGVVDESGVVKQRAGYATWGGKTQVQNSDARAEDRGYTGHEHLVEVDLIHMNGRVYDPGTGRFLSADPLIQDPYDGQSYNRYSYVRNNPLSFTDPSGYSWWTKWRKPIAAIAVAAITAGALSELMVAYAGEFGATALAGPAGLSGFGKAVVAVASGFASGGVQGGNIESAVAGAIGAGAFFAAGSIADAAMVGNAGFGRGEIGRVALHAVAGCARGAAAGGSCGKEAAAGAFSELAGPVIDRGGNNIAYRVAAHAVAGGLGSMAAGGKFENGAVTGAFGYLFNFMMHYRPVTYRDMSTWHEQVVDRYVLSLAPGETPLVASILGIGGEIGPELVSGVYGKIARALGRFAPDGYGTTDLPYSDRWDAYRLDPKLREIARTMNVELGGSSISGTEARALLEAFARVPGFVRYYGSPYDVLENSKRKYHGN